MFAICSAIDESARTFEVRSAGKPFKVPLLTELLLFPQICQRQKQGWTTVQDPLGRMGPYAYQGNQWVSFDDQASLRDKTKWIKEKGLGGGMIWALDLDDFNGVCNQGKYPLLTVIADGLNIQATSSEMLGSGTAEGEMSGSGSTSGTAAVTTTTTAGTTTTAAPQTPAVRATLC